MKKVVGHDTTCNCNRCFAHALGEWIDGLGKKTASGRWVKFATITYRTPSYPWRKDFPQGRVSPEFGNHFFDYFIRHLQADMGERVDYVETNQYGNLNGRFHQHAILAAVGLDQYPNRKLESWLRKHAGYSRVLPFRHGAAHYVARFAGREMQQAEWRLRIGNEDERVVWRPKRGIVVAHSARLPSECFHQCLRNRRR
jgi:hypothetical protein